MSDNPIIKARLEVISFNHALFVRAVGEDLTARQATRPLFEGGSHILWLTGHMAWTYDVVMGTGLTGGTTLLSPEWPSLFGQGSKAVDDPSKYPSLGDALRALEKTSSASFAYLATVPDSRLPENLPSFHPAVMFRTWDRLLQAACFHEAYHAGQVNLLRRGQGLPTAFR